MAASLYILRHGETLFNVQHKTQGWWVNTIVPDFSSLDDPSLPPQVMYR